MARRNATLEATSTTEAEVDLGSQTPTEAPAEKAAEKDDAPVDLTGFQAAVDEAVGNADPSTGEVTVEGFAKTNEAYRALDGLKPKNAARKSLDDQMTEAIYAGNAPKARSIVGIKENLSAGSSSGAKAPKDPTEAFVTKIATLQAALTVLFEEVPEGVTEGWEAKAETKAEDLSEAAITFKANVAADENFDASEVPADVKKVVKLAAGKSSGGSGYSGGPRRNVGKHIEEVFADLNVGDFLTVTEINKARSTEYGPDEAPTTGAISQKLFGAKGKPVTYKSDSVEAVNEDGQSRGARKIA